MSMDDLNLDGTTGIGTAARTGNVITSSNTCSTNDNDTDAENNSNENNSNAKNENIANNQTVTQSEISKRSTNCDEKQQQESSLVSTSSPSSVIVPMKKARTAYFIFQQEKRPIVVQELLSSSSSKYSVADVAKRIGQLWKDLTIEEKEIYQTQAKKEKELYEQYKLMHPTGNHNTVNGDKKNDDNNNVNAMVLPVSRIRKICRLDPDVKGLSKESTLLITKCAECFISKMANDTYSMTRLGRSNSHSTGGSSTTIQSQDIINVCELKEKFFFLKDDIKDLVNQQKREKEMMKKRKVSIMVGRDDDDDDDNDDEHQNQQDKHKIGKKMKDIVGVKPLTSYFTAPGTSKNN